MRTVTLAAAASATTYPGRGIVAGKSADGTKALLAYFIMGRSTNSRNRVFVEVGEGLRTEAFDPSQMVDPSLIIYNPVLVLGNDTIFTNGDQTDTIYNFMAEGKTSEEALRTREYEPDAPNYTPRISAVAHVENGEYSLQMSILKCADGKGGACARYFFEYPAIEAGKGYFIHTYMGDGNPIPSFEGEPEWVEMGNTAIETAETLWEALNEDNKVSLWVRSIDLASGDTETIILNKNEKE